MDYYKKMAQPKMDFSVFKPKRSKRAEGQENSAENTAKSIPNPKAVKEQETPVQEPKAKQIFRYHLKLKKNRNQN